MAVLKSRLITPPPPPTFHPGPFTPPLTPTSRRTVDAGSTLFSSTPTKLGKRLAQTVPNSWPTTQTLDSLWTPEMQLEIQEGYYRRYLQNSATSQEEDTQEEQDEFMQNCVKLGSVIIVSAPSDKNFVENRLNMLETIFTKDPRSDIFSLFDV